jgi:glycosyltransferase involved in cell wall biosynthesis
MLTHVRILTYALGNPTSGQSRFARTLAEGLQKVGVEVSIACAWATSSSLAALKEGGVAGKSVRLAQPSSTRQQMEVMRPHRVLKELATAALRDGKADWLVVLSDELVSIGRYLGDTQKNAYLSNGDFMVLFFNEAYYRGGRTRTTLASTLASTRIRQHASDARTFDLLLANSEFTRNFMSYLYGVPFAGVCYPPIDPDTFHPSAPKSAPPFALSIARNLREQGLDTLERIAARVPLKVVGGVRVKGAESLGVVDDSTLASLYSRAALLVAPVVSEFFGYPIAEALSCGTPVASYSVCGPGELVRDGVNGWTADSAGQLERIVQQAVHGGVPASLAEEAARSARRFHHTAVARTLVDTLSGYRRSS